MITVSGYRGRKVEGCQVPPLECVVEAETVPAMRMMNTMERRRMEVQGNRKREGKLSFCEIRNVEAGLLDCDIQMATARLWQRQY